MNITLDRTTQDKLAALDRVARICDEDGVVLGYFMPVVDPALYRSVESPLSEEELRRRAADRTGRPLREILADLEKQA